MDRCITTIGKSYEPMEEVKYPSEQFPYDGDKDLTDGLYLTKPIMPYAAEYYYQRIDILASMIDVMAEDTILSSDIDIESERLDTSEIVEKLSDFRREIGFCVQDYCLYGAGCLLIQEDTVNNTFMLQHVPQNQLSIAKQEFSPDGKHYPVVVQQFDSRVAVESFEDRQFLMFDHEYPEGFEETLQNYSGMVAWMGGSMFFNYYHFPDYVQLLKDMDNKIAIQKLDLKRFKNGNNTNGLLLLNKTGVKTLRSNQQVNDEEAPVEIDDFLPPYPAALKEALNKAQFANLVWYEESDAPMEMNYVQLNNDNWQYLEEKIKNLNEALLARWKIPAERLGINTVKESMNSNRLLTIYQIYLDYLRSFQNNVIIPLLQNILFSLYGEKFSISMSVPSFPELQAAEMENIRLNFDMGLISYGDAVREMRKFYEDIDEIELDEEVANDYFYKGKSLTNRQLGMELMESFGGVSNFGNNTNQPSNNENPELE